MKLSLLTNWMDDFLQHDSIQDYPNAFNGLQVENQGEATRVACAVDACEAVIQEAIARDCDFLLVHHGLFWNGGRPLTGATFRKFQTILRGGLAVYSSHLPLDFHPEVGNNAVLARHLGMPPGEPFLEMSGRKGGVASEWKVELPELLQLVEQATGCPAHCAAGGPGKTGKVGLVSGGAGSEIAAVARQGIDTFITGEGPHWSYTLAEELGVNLIYAGHYATETFGVKALSAKLEQEFSLPWEFLDHPTGL